MTRRVRRRLSAAAGDARARRRRDRRLGRRRSRSPTRARRWSRWSCSRARRRRAPTRPRRSASRTSPATATSRSSPASDPEPLGDDDDRRRADARRAALRRPPQQLRRAGPPGARADPDRARQGPRAPRRRPQPRGARAAARARGRERGARRGALAERRAAQPDRRRRGGHRPGGVALARARRAWSTRSSTTLTDDRRSTDRALDAALERAAGDQRPQPARTLARLATLRDRRAAARARRSPTSAPDLAIDASQRFGPFLDDAEATMDVGRADAQPGRQPARQEPADAARGARSRVLTAPLDIAAAAGAVLDTLLGERELQRALFSADGYGQRAEGRGRRRARRGRGRGGQPGRLRGQRPGAPLPARRDGAHLRDRSACRSRPAASKPRSPRRAAAAAASTMAVTSAAAAAAARAAAGGGGGPGDRPTGADDDRRRSPGRHARRGRRRGRRAPRRDRRRRRRRRSARAAAGGDGGQGGDLDAAEDLLDFLDGAMSGRTQKPGARPRAPCAAARSRLARRKTAARPDRRRRSALALAVGRLAVGQRRAVPEPLRDQGRGRGRLADPQGGRHGPGRRPLRRADHRRRARRRRTCW